LVVLAVSQGISSKHHGNGQQQHQEPELFHDGYLLKDLSHRALGRLARGASNTLTSGQFFATTHAA
jgi:hypothetical protein